MNLRRTFLLFLLGLFIAGCGDSEVNSNVNVERDASDPTAPGIGDEYFMVPAGNPNPIINVSETYPLEVYLYSKRLGTGAANQRISFEIVEMGGTQASITSLNSTTNESGAAEVGLRAGAQPGTITVRANHPSSNSVEFKVQVEPLSVGDLNVRLVHPSPHIMPYYDIEVRLYQEDEFSCDEFLPFFEPPMASKQGQAATVNDTVLFEGLGSRQRFVITGRARGDRGQVAGAGCVNNVVVIGDASTEVELILPLIPLMPAGKYEVQSFWDFSDAVADSGAVGATIMRILNIFENPGAALYDEIINLVRSVVGGLISGAISLFLSLTGLDVAFQDMINDFIANNSALSRIFQAGNDLRDVIANLHVTSELTIGKLSNNYEFRGADNWLGVTLYWRWNCDVNSPADCGAIPIVADGQGAFGSLGILSSEWDGRVVNYNQLQIDQHTLSLRYGRLIIYILNEVVLPALTNGNANSLSQAFAYWIGCDRLARAITGSSGERCALGACIRDHQIESFCTTAISTIFGFADLLIRGLEFDVGLRLGGQGTLIELNSDGFVDLIEDGVFSGFLQNSDGVMTTSPFEANWSAERINFDTDQL